MPQKKGNPKMSSTSYHRIPEENHLEKLLSFRKAVWFIFVCRVLNYISITIQIVHFAIATQLRNNISNESDESFLYISNCSLCMEGIILNRTKQSIYDDLNGKNSSVSFMNEIFVIRLVFFCLSDILDRQTLDQKYPRV
jgi:hypothetical protein